MTAPKLKLGPNYSALCDAVEKHDPKAAKWMREEGARRESVRENMTVAESDPDNLFDAFSWPASPQGGCYWSDLDKLVGTVTPAQGGA